MSQIIYQILNYEVTPIPATIGKLFGTKINNGLCNGALWLFVFWTCFHILFDASIYNIFKRIEYKPYICARLTSSFWFLAVFIAFFSYSLSIVAKYRLDLFNWKSKFFHTNVDPPIDISIGILLLSTFYLHTALYQRIRLDTSESVLKYTLLSVIYAWTYAVRKVEVPLILSVFMSVSEISTEITRVLFCLPRDTPPWRLKLQKGTFIFGLLIWIVTYIIIIPLRLLLSPVKRIWYDFRILQAILILFLIVWFITNLYESVLLKWFSHWLEYTKDEKYSILSDDALEIALFNSRKDPAFYWKTLRSETKTREDEMIGRRKPNNRNVLFQTIKCMLAIKRKKNERKDCDEDCIENEVAEETKSDDGMAGTQPEKFETETDEDYQEGKLVINLQKEENSVPDSKENIENHIVCCTEE